MNSMLVCILFIIPVVNAQGSFLDGIPLVCRDQPPQDECGQTELYYTFKYNSSGHATCLPLEDMCTHISETNTFLQEDWCTGLCIDGFPEECFLPINPAPCTGEAPDPPHYFFSATQGDYDYGCHQLQPGQCNNNANSFSTEAACISRCQEFVRPPAPPPPPPPPPPTCAPCPECPTTPAPTPPELQCPVCTCTPVYHGSYATLKANKESSYSCSKAHLPAIDGISETFHNYYGVLNCPSLCYAKCGNTYHCCVAPPPPAQSENCFPSSANVKLENGKSVTMAELQIGDKVQTVSQGTLKFSEVTAFLQKQENVFGKYKEITALSNDTIALSDRHLIYARGSVNEQFHARYADEVTNGNEVLVRENGQLKAAIVKEVSNFVMQGAYVPLTDEGNIVVDGVLASCYASFDHDLAHFSMTPVKLFPQLIQWVFGDNNGIQGYLSLAKIFGRYIVPDEYLYVSYI